MLGIFGPNGAGKTTFVRQITVLLRSTPGRIKFLGQDVARRYGSFYQWVLSRCWLLPMSTPYFLARL
ncbi:ATP-binding cassette domain-containing protein [Calidithermus roseus]|uniref:ATP-binding cassette domain-containing protein n=1 Tax=Calidithermus roseus TaxID=1644118 RepID=UPI001C7166BE